MEDRRNFVAFESMVWLIIGTLITLLFYGNDFFNFTITSIESIHSLILFSSICFFPFFFELIVGKLPFELLRSIINPSKEKIDNPPQEANNENYNVCDIYIKHYAKVAGALLNKSNKYIFLGYILALSGIIIFILLTGQMNVSHEDSLKHDTLKNVNIWNYVIYLITINLPRFGVLFFIEYIAIFFLKQYRILLEEFRYYKLIECNLIQYKIVMKFIEEHKTSPEIIDKFICYIDSHSIFVPQITGSHKIKTEKMLNEDMDFISKLTTLIQTIKTPDKAKE